MILADGSAPIADAAFSDPGALSPTDAWIGATAFAMQIYFDFSGYTDIAIGTALCFGIRLPINFDSPYRATSIIDFWRCWHMTFSRFLRDYLYFPLGGNRKGPMRRYANLMIVMALGGLWRGASWTFVTWGLLHGALLAINHGWQALIARTISVQFEPCPRLRHLWRFAAWALTFLTVIVSWVPFRADSLDSTLAIWATMANIMFTDAAVGLVDFFASGAAVITDAMLGIQAIVTGVAPRGTVIDFSQIAFERLLLVVALGTALLLPSSQSLVFNNGTTAPEHVSDGTAKLFPSVKWRPNIVTGIGLGMLFTVSVLNLSREVPFLYFQF